MAEQAALAIRAVHAYVERSAFFGLVLLIFGVLLNELLLSVSELALLVVAADACLNPVLAHFGLVLSFVRLGLLKVRIRLLKIGANVAH